MRYVSTGADHNAMSYSVAKKIGLDEYIDKTYSAKIIGIGTGKMIGCIPIIDFTLGDLLVSSNFSIIDDSESKSGCTGFILLGMPFMMFYAMSLDFAKSKIITKDHMIDIKIREK